METISENGGANMVVEMIQNKEVWDGFVDKSPYGLIFHKWDFLKIVEQYSGYKLFTCGIYRGDSLIGVFPLFYKKILLLKTIFSPPPQSGIPYLGFVMNSEYDELKQDKKETYLAQVINEVNQSLSPNYTSVSTVSNFMDVRPFKWENYDVTPDYNYVMNLDKDLKIIWNDFKKNLRKQLSGPDVLKLRLISSNNIEQFYNFMGQRYKEQGLTYPIYCVEYLEALFEAYPMDGECKDFK